MIVFRVLTCSDDLGTFSQADPEYYKKSIFFSHRSHLSTKTLTNPTLVTPIENSGKWIK